MSLQLLLDEHVQHEVYYRLQESGHDVEHVHFYSSIQPGDTDQKLAEISQHQRMIIVTYDEDFESEYTESDYWGVLLFSDDDWSADDVADTIHRILEQYDESTLSQMNLVGREWL